jgi:hypothetical protein
LPGDGVVNYLALEREPRRGLLGKEHGIGIDPDAVIILHVKLVSEPHIRLAMGAGQLNQVQQAGQCERRRSPT